MLELPSRSPESSDLTAHLKRRVSPERQAAAAVLAPRAPSDYRGGMSDTLRFTIHYSDGVDGWIMGQVEEVPGAISQGGSREDARENVTDALRLMQKPEPDATADPHREPLDLPLAS